MAKKTDQQEAQKAQILNSDPELQAIIQRIAADTTLAQQLKGAKGKLDQARILAANPNIRAYTQRIKALGIDTGEWRVGFKNGQLTIDHQNWLEKHPLATTSIIIGSVAAPFVATGLAGTGGAGAAATTGGTGAVVGPTAASAPSWAAKLFGDGLGQDLIKAGIGTGIGFLERRARNKAEQEAIDRALAEQRRATAEANARLDRQERFRGEIYNQQRSDFQGLANGPFQKLGGFLGIDIPTIGPVKFKNALGPDPSSVPSGGPNPSVPGGPFAPGTGGQAPGSGLGAPGTTAPPTKKGLTLTQFGSPAQIGVPLLAPDGTVQSVHPSEVEHYLSLGARRVG